MYSSFKGFKFIFLNTYMRACSKSKITIPIFDSVRI